MKAKTLLFIGLVAIPAIALFTSGTLDQGGHSISNSNGILAAAGSPGEPGTCSESGCHGAGNGNSTTGGLPDNGGPGSISVSASPVFFNGNQYMPGQLYHINITVSENGKGLFGFCSTILDNTGNTNLHVNNVAGTLTITDPVRTKAGQAFGTGRKFITHLTNAGLMANTSTFTYDWTAPAGGTVNIYYAGIAANNDGLEDAPDNVYIGSLQLTQAAVGISQVQHSPQMSVYPNPAKDNFTVRCKMAQAGELIVDLYSITGKLVKRLVQENASGDFVRTFATDEFDKGVYVLRIAAAHANECKKIIID